MDAVRRGVEHVLEGQEAIGVWPYLFATIGRGQAFSEQSVPDHGMLLYHLLQAVQYEPFRNDPEVHKALIRAAQWYLCTSYLHNDGSLINLQYDPETPGDHGLSFSSFTWCRFMAAASLFRIAEITGREQPWRSLALKYMEYVRSELWNTADPDTAPVIRSCKPDIERVTWIQAAEWDAVLLLELIDRMNARSESAISK
jgi:hypothetical protein